MRQATRRPRAPDLRRRAGSQHGAWAEAPRYNRAQRHPARAPPDTTYLHPRPTHAQGPDGNPADAPLRRKQEAVLAAASRLFNHKGVRGTTLSDVAQEVGLSTNSITYYYRKKEDTVVACLLRAIGEMVEMAGLAARSHATRAGARLRRPLLRAPPARPAASARMMSFREIRALPTAMRRPRSMPTTTCSAASAACCATARRPRAVPRSVPPSAPPPTCCCR